MHTFLVLFNNEKIDYINQSFLINIRNKELLGVIKKWH